MLCIKDVAKWDHVAIDIDTSRWEEFAEHRLAWRSAMRNSGDKLKTRWLESLAKEDSDSSTFYLIFSDFVMLHAIKSS